MGHLASWYRERPRRVEAIQLAGPDAIDEVARFTGARTWRATDVDLELYGTPNGTMVVAWCDWVVRIHAPEHEEYEVVPGPLFSLVYEPSVL